jgi:hypothetical protein
MRVLMLFVPVLTVNEYDYKFQTMYLDWNRIGTGG